MDLTPQMMSPKLLKPHPGNSKRHPEEQVQSIAKSIAEFGFDQPVVVTKDLVIIKGHGRTLASILLGLDLIPVVVRDVDDNDAIFLREVDNSLQSTEWDVENLASELLELKGLDKLEFSLFSEDQIPDLPQMTMNIKQEDFDVTTKHECNKCHYRW